MATYPSSGILLEAESFDDFGGWVLDSQFAAVMGSPYLLAHGNGKPVADATTVLSIPTGGAFSVITNDKALDVTFGTNDQDWEWQLGGVVELLAGQSTVVLHDLTGFCGRCDALYFSIDDTTPPQTSDDAAREWRRQLRGSPPHPVDGGALDVVVVGGGIAGLAAALAAARLGERVSLIQNRSYLGGNASLEIGLSPRGVTGSFINELSRRTPEGDLMARQLLEAEPTATMLLEYEVYNAVVVDSTIKSVDARAARSGQEVRITSPIFIDCSGTAILGLLSGAEIMFGQEARAEFGKSLAPEKRDDMHHGNTLFFRTRLAEKPVSFPSPGTENGPGPLGEQIRDHLLRALYGTFHNVKTIEPEKYAALDFDWVAYVPAQGEYRRYKGDYILCENDVREHRVFPDTVVQNGGAFCLHYPGDEKYDKTYDIPFRCLYSTNIANLMMAVKHMSATHVASSNTKFMGNGGQHGIAVACAAHLCHKFQTTPRGVYEYHLGELQTLAAGFVDKVASL
ncbi:FAD dependent oxidoreductase-domain-containing protein [Hypoxylon sp. FL0890]|nr:FAD dependent oxidoreductase-domain-containing protein [Hypoxylon sp. FL0890]